MKYRLGMLLLVHSVVMLDAACAQRTGGSIRRTEPPHVQDIALEDVLIKAVDQRKYFEVAALLRAGANPTRVRKYRYHDVTALHICQCPGIMELLLKAPCTNPNQQLQSCTGPTPLFVAVHACCIAPQKSHALVKILLQQGVAKSLCTPSQRTIELFYPLEVAAFLGDAWLVHKLAQALPATVTRQGSNQQTPFRLAAYRGHSNVTALLKEKWGVKPTQEDIAWCQARRRYDGVHRNPKYVECIDPQKILIKEL